MSDSKIFAFDLSGSSAIFQIAPGKLQICPTEWAGYLLDNPLVSVDRKVPLIRSAKMSDSEIFAFDLSGNPIVCKNFAPLIFALPGNFSIY